MNRRQLLAGLGLAPFVGVGERQPAAAAPPAPTPLDRLRDQYEFVSVSSCDEGWWVWAGVDDATAGARRPTLDEAALAILNGDVE